jgi:hypothetical protein
MVSANRHLVGRLFDDRFGDVSAVLMVMPIIDAAVEPSSSANSRG